MDEQKNKDTNVKLGVKVSEKGLSMKAKGAGVICLLALSISGIIVVAYLMAIHDNTTLVVALLFLLYITYQLINVLHALFKTGNYISMGRDDD